MSTRRARIKAVASLPIRKRTVETSSTTVVNNKNVDDKSQSQSQSKTENPQTHSTSNTAQNALPTSTENACESSIPNTDNKDVSAKTDKANDVSKETTHRRRIMRPSINIPSNKRTKALEKSETQGAKKKQSPKPTKESKQTPLSKQKNIYNIKSPKPNSETPRTNSTVEKASDVAIDGIIPLKPPTQEPSETVSVESVEVDDSVILSTECNFDPIIPLPSPNKNRPKLRPMPRFAMRRNSLQGSASESEDDIRKNKRDETLTPQVSNTVVQPIISSLPKRIRNDSVCSLSADSNLHVTVPITPRQKINRYRSTTAGESRRAAAKKKALSGEQNTLTMCDLIYYNPPSESDGTKKKPSSNSKRNDKEVNPVQKKEEIVNKSVTSNSQNEENVNKNDSMPVPQVKLGPNGEIVIDEQSLVIETTDTVKSREEILKLSVVYENAHNISRGLYRRTSRTREWSHGETLRFYKALNTIGTDFALMLPLFPGRNRKSLKIKFKKEEKNNLALVNRALMNPLNFDISELQAQLLEEQKTISDSKKQKKESKKKKEHKYRNYHKSSAALRSMEDFSKKPDTSETFAKNKRKMQQNNNTASKIPKISTNNPGKNKEHFKTDTVEEIPKNVEPGSMVILVKKIANTVNRNTLQAYLSQLIDNETKLVPISLEINILKSIAREMNILHDDQEYELPEDVPIESDVNVKINNDVVPDSPGMLIIDDNILDDSTIDNYILTGKHNFATNDSANSPNIINLSHS